MKKLMIIFSALGLVLVATVAILLFLPDFPGFFAAEPAPAMAVLLPELPPPTQPVVVGEAGEVRDLQEHDRYTPQTIQDFFTQNQFPEGFVADNSILPWYLKLVNRYNVMDDDFEIELAYIGQRYFDARATDALFAMIDYAGELGLNIVVLSAYRGISHQRWLFNNQVQRRLDAGDTQEQAFEVARRVVAYPGTSEHNLGLAADLAVRGTYTLTEAFGQTDEGLWLVQNAHRFGFVLRYPYHKQHITNIIYEPWHFRYVSEYRATVMFENDLVLEEYLFWLSLR